MAPFEVRVVNADQRPLAGQKVTLEFLSLGRGMAREKHTDQDGVARFDGYEEGQINVYVNGRNYGGYFYEPGDHITITR